MLVEMLVDKSCILVKIYIYNQTLNSLIIMNFVEFQWCVFVSRFSARILTKNFRNRMLSQYHISYLCHGYYTSK